MLTHGTPIWTSIPAYDVARARTFYSTLFNWTYKPNTDQYPASQIAMIDFPDPQVQTLNIGGGIIKVSEDQKIGSAFPNEGVVVFLIVEDVDDVLAKVEGAGGKVLKGKEKEGEMGVMATLADTEGNSVGVYALVKK